MKILGIDYGRRRIGLAVSDETETIAGGLDSIDRKKTVEWFAVIQKHLEEQNIGKIVIGYPHHQNGSRSGLCDEIDKLISDLKDGTKAAVETVDESFTSETAGEYLRKRGVKSKRHKNHIDRVAACTILQSYLDEKEV